MIKIKNETGFRIELVDFQDLNGRSIFEPYFTMEFTTWDDFNPLQIIVYNDNLFNAHVYTSNGYKDSQGNHISEMYIDKN